MQIGDVWSVALPFAAGGREQTGQRPGIVVQDAAYGQRSPLVLVVPLTSQLSALRFPATVQFQPDPANGLIVPSVALVFQLRALDRSRFMKRLGRLERRDLSTVLIELDKLTGR